MHLEKKLIMMEFKRNSVIALYLTEKPQMAVVIALQHLNENKSFVSHTITRYRDSWKNYFRDSSFYYLQAYIHT